MENSLEARIARLEADLDLIEAEEAAACSEEEEALLREQWQVCYQEMARLRRLQEGR